MKLQQWARLQEAKKFMSVALNDAQGVEKEITDPEISDLLSGALQSVCEGLDIIDNILEL